MSIPSSNNTTELSKKETIIYDCEIVFIKGNPNSGSPQQHKEIYKNITDLINSYTYKIIDSNETYRNAMHIIPKSKIYIGFSRGSRYLNKLDTNSLKISIGGIKGSNIQSFTHNEDKVLSGDISESSMKAHFIIQEEDKLKIKNLIHQFLNPAQKA